MFKHNKEITQTRLLTALTVRAARALLAVATVLGPIHLAWGAGEHAGGHHEQQAHWMAPADAAKKANPVPATGDSMARGGEIYRQNCLVCHGAEGEGDGPAGAALKPPPANLKVMAPRHPDGDLAWKIAEGRGAMPAWNATLSEQDIWNVVNYIKQIAAAKGSSKAAGHHDDGDAHQHK